MWRAASEGNPRQLRDQLRSGKNSINATNSLGQTVLHVAVIAGQIECVAVLLAEQAVDVNRRDAELGWTPLHYAIFKKFAHIAVMLAARGAEIDVLDHKGFSPVDLAFVDTYPPPPPGASIATASSSTTSTPTSSLDNIHEVDWSDDEFERPKPQKKRASSVPTSVKAEETFGDLFTWGEGSNYCLGHGNPNSIAQPKRVTTLQEENIAQVSTSDFSTGVVTKSGRLYTFGVGTGGRLGHGDQEVRLVPKRVVGPLFSQRVVYVSMGHSHSACVCDDGSVFTWGSGAFGQLGHGTTEDSFEPRKIKSKFEGQKPVAVATGRHHTVVLTAKGGVWTFGCGENGELGYATAELATKRAFCHCSPRQVVSIDVPVMAIAVGKAHTVCATQAGDVILFGFGSSQPRKLFLPSVMPSVAAAFQQLQQQALASSSSSSSPSSSTTILPTPVFSISPAQTSFGLLAGDGGASPSNSTPMLGALPRRGAPTSLVATGNMTLVVFNRRDVFFSDLYHVENLQTRLPKPLCLPPLPGNNTIASVALTTAKEIIVVSGTGHLWKCTEISGSGKSDPREAGSKAKAAAAGWSWRRIAVGRQFTHVACSRNHFAAVAQREALVEQRVEVSPRCLSAHLLKELENDDFTDVEFVLDDGHRVPAHRIVLAMRSSHFKSLFSSTAQEDEGEKKPAADERPVWGEADSYYVPGMASLLSPKKRREVPVHDVPHDDFMLLMRLIYTDSHDPAAPRVTSREKEQIAYLVKRFGLKSSARDNKGKSVKGKERDTDDNPSPSAPGGGPAATSSKFEAELSRAFDDELLTDVELISADEDRIACHRVIICSQSEVLRTMLTIGMLESRQNEIFIQNASTITLQKVKEFLYLGTFAELLVEPSASGGAKKAVGGGREMIPFATLMELLNISNQFMLERMKETLEDLLLHQYLDFDNFCSLLVTAERYSCYNLKRQLFAFAQRNFIALLLGNVTKDLLDHADHGPDLLDDLDFFLQSGGRLREEVEAAGDADAEAAEAAARALEEEAEELRRADADELLTYFSEEEIQRQIEMEAFWDRERQIEKERENQKANEQRRRAAKARAKARAAGKTRVGPLRKSASKTPEKPVSDETVADVKASAAPMRASIEAANRALAREYSATNEEATRLVKRLRALKKKLAQIDNLKDKQAKGAELDDEQEAKLAQESALEEEISALLSQLEEAARPPPPQPAAPKASKKTSGAAAASANQPKPPRDKDEFFLTGTGAGANRNRRRTNSNSNTNSNSGGTKAKPVATPQPVPQSQPQPQPQAAPAAPGPSLAPWAVKKPATTVAAPAVPATPASGASPQKAKSLVEIQQEELRRQREGRARPQQLAAAPSPQRKIKLDGSVATVQAPGRPAQQQQHQVAGNADNESPGAKFALSLAIGGKAAASPVRVITPGAAAPSLSPSKPTSGGGLRTSANNLPSSSPSRAAVAPSRPPTTAAAFPPLGASPQRPDQAATPSLADIQREEQQRLEAERRRREVVKPTKKSLKQIQDEQEEAGKIQALFGDELRQIYGHDVDLESIW